MIKKENLRCGCAAVWGCATSLGSEFEGWFDSDMHNLLFPSILSLFYFHAAILVCDRSRYCHIAIECDLSVACRPITAKMFLRFFRDPSLFPVFLCSRAVAYLARCKCSQLFFGKLYLKLQPALKKRIKQIFKQLPETGFDDGNVSQFQAFCFHMLEVFRQSPRSNTLREVRCSLQKTFHEKRNRLKNT